MTTKFCKDCRHAMINSGDVENSKCELSIRHRHGEDYLVTGMHQRPTYSYCATARMDDQPCGLEGKLFEVNLFRPKHEPAHD